MSRILDLSPMPEKLRDFRGFLYHSWKFLSLPAPTRVQYDIAYWLQYGDRRKVIEAFRGVGKSWITSVYVVWRLRMNPQLKFLVVSASQIRSIDFSTFTLRLIKEMPILQCLTPDKTEGDRDSKLSFDVAPARNDHAPSVKSVGISGQLAGSRADEIIADDIEIPNNSMTQPMRDKLSNAVKEFDAILKPDGRITYLGTPQCEESLYNLLPERGYKVRIWPARYPDKNNYKCNEANLAPMLIRDLAEYGDKLRGRPTDPQRFNEVDLQEREASYGRSGFALQFMLDTSLSDADRYPLKLNDLIIYPIDSDQAPEKLAWGADPRNIRTDLPNVGMQGDRYYSPIFISEEWHRYTGKVLHIDPSGRGKDELSYAVTYMLNGYIHCPECSGIRGVGYSDEALEKLARVAKRHQVNLVVIESNYGDGMFNKLLQPVLNRIYPCTIDEIRSSKQKELRIIDTLEPVMNQHRLVIDPNVIIKDWESVRNLPPDEAKKYCLFYQMSRITKEKNSLGHDDRLDVLAMGVAYWVEQMSQDADKQISKHKDTALREELNVFLGHAHKSLDAQVMGMPGKSFRPGISFIKNRR